MSSIAPYAKALVGAAVAGLASLQQALDGDNTITGSEWMAAAVAFVGAAVAVFYIPYRTTAEPAPKPDEGGAVDLVAICAVLLAFYGTCWFLFEFLNLGAGK